jgi:GNAT superfamily N-acetyltransferase
VEAWRPATADDLPRLTELAAQAVAEQRLLKGGAVWARREARQAPYEAQLADELSSPSAHVVVGTLEETILGYGVAVIEDLADGGRLGRVTDLYVEPGGREVGIGEALMGALVGWCTDEGCIGVDSLALPGDRATKNFFESFGLVARAIVVHRPLP